jgi:hypothetical protein
MLLILQGLFFAIGLLVVLTGRAGINDAGLHGSRARWTGFLLMIPLIVHLILLAIADINLDSPGIEGGTFYAIVEYVVTLGSLAGAGLLFMTAPPQAVE